MAAEILRMENICKEYSDGNEALHNACISIKKGEIHALVGKNGSGKSTLVKVAGGVIQPDRGVIFFKDNRVNIRSADAAQQLGISVVHQHCGIIEQLDVTENIFMGNEKKRMGVVLCRREMYRKARLMLDKAGLNINERTRMKELPYAQQQLVLMIKALSQHPDLIILDEMTAALTKNEFGLIKNILDMARNDGISVLFISHKLEEVMTLADRVTVLYEGTTMGTYDIDRCSAEFLLVAMTNGMVKDHANTVRKASTPNEVLLEARGIAARYGVNGVDLILRRNEVLGIAGVVGSGRSTLLKLLYGVEKMISGSLNVCGREYWRFPGEQCRHISFMPEEYINSGLFGEMDVNFNIAVANLDKCTRCGVVNRKKVNNLSAYYINKLDIGSNGGRKVKNLSGGNKQRVMFARYMACKSEILLLDEPFKGVDETARAEFYQFIEAVRQEGRGVIITSEVVSELVDICDRIVVMKNGRITCEFGKEQATEVAILNAMMK